MIERLAAALALAFCGLYTPAAQPVFSVCGFRWLTGRPCPLCGMTRALCSLVKGDWQAALDFHALSPLALAILGAVLVRGTWRRGWGLIAAVFALYGVARLMGWSPAPFR